MKTTHLPPFCFFFENLREKPSRIFSARESCCETWGRLWWYVYLAECQRAMPGWDRLIDSQWASVHFWICQGWFISPGRLAGHGRAPYGKRDPYYSQTLPIRNIRIPKGMGIVWVRGPIIGGPWKSQWICGCKSHTLHPLSNSWCDVSSSLLGVLFHIYVNLFTAAFSMKFGKVRASPWSNPWSLTQPMAKL